MCSGPSTRLSKCFVAALYVALMRAEKHTFDEMVVKTKRKAGSERVRTEDEPT
jgi:hypothetical protein